MVKYPMQSLIGGTLLLTLAVSLGDGSAAQKETSVRSVVRVACGSLPVPYNQPTGVVDRPEISCFRADTKK